MPFTDSFTRYADKIRGKVILITGGTGSFGTAVTEALLHLEPKQVIIFSRDEKKQFDMLNHFDDARLSFVVGDTRDRDAVDGAMKGVNYVFHAAALKQVLTGEFFPLELVKTNIIGSNNVIESAIAHGVERVVVLSTDKASTPTSAMGMTKALMERLMIAATRRNGTPTILCATRFGNVLYSRGSVVPYLIERIKEGKSVTVTDPHMTRFVMTLDQALDLVLFAITSGHAGEIYVRKAPVAMVSDIVEVVAELFSHTKPIEEIGARPGENIHEYLITPEECARAVDRGEYFSIAPEALGKSFPEAYFENSDKDMSLLPEAYGSGTAPHLSKDEVKELILSLPEVQSELALRAA